MPQTGKNKNRPAEPSQQGTGLKMTAHPLLLDTTAPAPQSKKDRYKPMQPKFASIKVRRPFYRDSVPRFSLLILVGQRTQCSYATAGSNAHSSLRNVLQPVCYRIDCTERQWRVRRRTQRTWHGSQFPLQ